MHPYPYYIANTSKEHSRAKFSGTDVLQVWRLQLHPAVCFCLCLSPFSWDEAPTSWWVPGFRQALGELGRKSCDLCGVDGFFLTSFFLLVAVHAIFSGAGNGCGIESMRTYSLCNPRVHCLWCQWSSMRGWRWFSCYSLNYVTILIRLLEFSNS